MEKRARNGRRSGALIRLGVLLAVAVAAAACETKDAAESARLSRGCGVDGNPILTSEGMGAFKVGASVDELRTACLVLRDTTLEQGTEGQPERRVSVRLGPDTIEATIQRGRVWRIEVLTPRIRTDDSIGVGSTFAMLPKEGTEYLGYGEGGPFVRITRHCGLSLDLAGVPGFVRRMEEIPATARVERVLVIGCRGQ